MLERNRTDRAREEDRLRELEREQANNLKVVQQQAKRAEDKVERLKKAEAEMLTLLATMEEARKKAATSRAPAVRAAAASSSVKTSDYGKLDWPVDGSLVYTFGKDHWKGIGIAAPAGTPVKTVSGGKVTVSRRLDTYGLTVIVDHGGGDYTVYASLKDASVKEGETIAKGDVIGTTGVSDPDMPAHLHFEIRTSGGRDAVDPVKWLRKNRG
jgi:murein DD-endopeptidase MepM/ murein hydrolase activator NlpD